MNTREIFNLLIIFGITVAVWIGYEAYSSATKNTLPEFRAEISTPIDPNLDLELLRSLSSKIYYQKPQ